jgi:hypothetical protein
VRALVENPYYLYFCGEEFFQHRLVFDRSSLRRWRNSTGKERLQSQSRVPHGPQPSLAPSGRRQQCHPCRRRLQLPPPDLLAQAFMTPNPDHPHRNASACSSLKAALFTDDDQGFNAQIFDRTRRANDHATLNPRASALQRLKFA